MKVEIFSGCMSGGIEIDGKRLEHLQPEEARRLRLELCNKLHELMIEDSIDLAEVVKLLPCDETRDLGCCEQCGDHSEVECYEL